MRINLVTPFADKDKAKALGARWDAARKVWYIVDVADLTPFMRWIPDLVAASQEVVAPGVSAGTAAAGGIAKAARPIVVTKPVNAVADCGCVALPWEECAHTAAWQQ